MGLFSNLYRWYRQGCIDDAVNEASDMISKGYFSDKYGVRLKNDDNDPMISRANDILNLRQQEYDKKQELQQKLCDEPVNEVSRGSSIRQTDYKYHQRGK